MAVLPRGLSATLSYVTSVDFASEIASLQQSFVAVQPVLCFALSATQKKGLN